jgi:hypothetical protein
MDKNRNVSHWLFLYGLPIFIIPLHDSKIVNFNVENNYHFQLSNMMTFTCSESLQIRQWVHYIRKSIPIKIETVDTISCSQGIRKLQRVLSSTSAKAGIPKIILQKQFMMGTLIINSPVCIDGNHSCIRNEENDEPTIIITCKDVYISNLVIQHGKFDDNDHTCAVHIKGNQSHATFSECFVKSDRNAILVDANSQIEMTHSTIHHSYHGIVLGNRSHAVVEQSKIVKNHCGIFLSTDASIELYTSCVIENDIGIFSPHDNNDSLMNDNTIERNGKNISQVYCNNNLTGILVNQDNK